LAGDGDHHAVPDDLSRLALYGDCGISDPYRMARRIDDAVFDIDSGEMVGRIAPRGAPTVAVVGMVGRPGDNGLADQDAILDISPKAGQQAAQPIDLGIGYSAIRLAHPSV
jgi:hypothetical protein